MPDAPLWMWPGWAPLLAVLILATVAALAIWHTHHDATN